MNYLILSISLIASILISNASQIGPYTVDNLPDTIYVYNVTQEHSETYGGIGFSAYEATLCYKRDGIPCGCINIKVYNTTSSGSSPVSVMEQEYTGVGYTLIGLFNRTIDGEPGHLLVLKYGKYESYVWWYSIAGNTEVICHSLMDWYPETSSFINGLHIERNTTGYSV